MNRKEAIRLFGLNNLSIEAEIRRVESETGVEFGHQKAKEQDIDQTYYPQFAEWLRAEAERMSANYIIFYCLENHIRSMIVERLQEEYGSNWWEQSVPESVRKNAEKNQKNEVQSGIAPRSTELIDFTNFGELGEIIKSNWEIFSDMFRDKVAVEKILATLNHLRAPIAHNKALAENDEVRLHLEMRNLFDW